MPSKTPRGEMKIPVPIIDPTSNAMPLIKPIFALLSFFVIKMKKMNRFEAVEQFYVRSIIRNLRTISRFTRKNRLDLIFLMSKRKEERNTRRRKDLTIGNFMLKRKKRKHCDFIRLGEVFIRITARHNFPKDIQKESMIKLEHQ